MKMLPLPDHPFRFYTLADFAAGKTEELHGESIAVDAVLSELKDAKDGESGENDAAPMCVIFHFHLSSLLFFNLFSKPLWPLSLATKSCTSPNWHASR